MNAPDGGTSDSAASAEGGVPETRWTLVSRAFRHTDVGVAAVALRDLCETYWPTLYRVARKRTLNSDEALEVVHEFVCELLAGRVNLGAASALKGRFRNYLWTTFTNFLTDRFRRASSMRAGGRLRFVSLDDGERRDVALLHPVEHLTPEQTFEKSLALDTVSRAMSAQRSRWLLKNDLQRYERLKEYLATPLKGERARVLSQQLNVSESRCRGMVAELKQEFRDIVRQMVAETLATPTSTEIDDEVDWLWRSLQL